MLFEERGAEIVIADINATRGSMIEKDSKTGRIKFKTVDLTNRNQIDKLIVWIDTHYEKIDVMINNASRGARFSVLNISLEDWDATVALNLTAPFLFSRFAAQKMIKTKTKGRIINIGAIQALYPRILHLRTQQPRGADFDD